MDFYSLTAMLESRTSGSRAYCYSGGASECSDTRLARQYKGEDGDDKLQLITAGNNATDSATDNMGLYRVMDVDRQWTVCVDELDIKEVLNTWSQHCLFPGNRTYDVKLYTFN